MMAKKTQKRGSLSKQVIAIVVLCAVCLALAATLIAVNIISGYRKFTYGDDTYYIVRQTSDTGVISYIMTDESDNPLDTSPDGYFILKDGTLVALDQTTGLAEEYIRPDTEGNEQIGLNDRVLIYPHTQKSQVQSIEVHNSNGSFTFYRMRIYEDTDKISYVCTLRNGEYYLIDENSNEFYKGEDGLYTLTSGNKISIDPHTGIILTHTYYDFDGKAYFVRKNAEGEYKLYDKNGTEVTKSVSGSGTLTNSDGEEYTAVLYSYLVTDSGTLIAVDPEYGTLSVCAVREYNGSRGTFSTYYFVLRGGKYVVCGADGETIKYTAIDDSNYYRTDNSAYIAFNEENGGYNVRVRKNYYIKPDNNGSYALYNKGTLLNANGSGYYAIDSTTYVSFDTASGSYSIMEFTGETYEETDTKYLNASSAADAEGDFVIEGFETTTYDPSLFSALIVSGGYTITAAGGKLSEPVMLKDENGNATDKIDFAAYGLAECIRTDDTGKPYTYKPAYYILKDIEGNVHKLTIGDSIVSGAGFYIKYEGLDENGEFAERQAVYILLDNQTQGYTQTYEIFTYYTISDTLLASLESVITPMAIYPITTNNYFDVEDFALLTYNSVKSRDNLLNDDPEDDEDYYDTLIRFSYEDVEERRNTALANFPYIMKKGCLLYGYIINSYSVDACLMSLMDMDILGVSHLGVDDRDLEKYGLDVPEYMIYFKHAAVKNLDGSNDQVLLISKMTPNETYYVYSQAYDMIVEVARNSLEFLNWKSTEWVTTDFYDINIGFADNVRIESGDYWANFNVDMSHTLTTNVKSSGSSNFIHTVETNSDKSEHKLTVSAKIYANVASSVATTNLMTVKFSTLENYYRSVTRGNTDGLTATERSELKAFTDTIYQDSQSNGQAMTVHAMTLSDTTGQAHDVYIYYLFDMDGEISVSVAVNKESPCMIFSKKAYEAYEKVMFSDPTLTTAEKRLAFDFYLASNVSASTNIAFEQVVGTNSEGTTTVFTNEKIVKNYSDGRVITDYALGSDYRVFFDVGEDGDLVGVSRSWIRYYDMDDPETTQSGAFIDIKDSTYTFTASNVRLILPLSDGSNKALKDGSLGKGNYTVTVTDELVLVVDENGNETRYLRYSGTTPFSNFYSTFLWASYEGYCDIPEEQKAAFRESDDSAAQMKLSIDLLSGENYTYKTYQYSERRSYITANGQGDFFVLRSFVDKIINTSKVIFDGTNVDPTDKY